MQSAFQTECNNDNTNTKNSYINYLRTAVQSAKEN